MADEPTTEATSQTTETPAPTTDAQTTPPSSSTTDQASDGIDLGAGASDDKPEGGDAPTEGGDQPEDKPAENAELFGAPADDAAYEIEGLPEGMNVDKEALEAAAPIFRELGLSNKGASKVAQVYAEKVLPGVAERATTAAREQLQNQIVDQRKSWEGESLDAITGKAELKTATGDKVDFGGRSAAQVKAICAKGIDRLAPAGFREFLADTGLGQHPAMVALTFNAGLAIAEDSDHDTSSTAMPKAAKSQAQLGKSGGLDPDKFYS